MAAISVPTVVMAANSVATVLMATVLSAILPAAFTFKAMSTPTMLVSPVSPGTDAKKHTVVEIALTIEAVRSTFVRFVIIVAILTHWRLVDDNNGTSPRPPTDVNAKSYLS
jgi:hypothetical protein